MRKGLTICALALAFAACSQKRGEPLSLRIVRSEMARCPEASYLDGKGGELKWNYTTGLELLSFLDVYEDCGDETILDYVDAWYDAIIAEDGTVGANYKRSKHNIDHICPARTLFTLNRLRPRDKYSKAEDFIFAQLQEQPRTEAGAFWHKDVYPNQVWLDGLYMGEPFYAEYIASRGLGSLWDDVALQFEVAAARTYDPATGLWRHAWDESRSMFWADSVTGQSAHCWGRALGWYTVALTDVLELFPEEHPRRHALENILKGILEVLPLWADADTHMWYQVLDRPGAEGNYLESTCSAMFVYSYLKAARRGEVDGDYAASLFRSLRDTFIREDEGGLVSLTNCCSVAGLGGKQMRKGDYDYYINEPVCDNDPKGMGALIRAALIYEADYE